MTTRDTLQLAHRVAQVAYDATLATATTCVTRGQVRITLGRIYMDGDARTRDYVLAHELAHIARGDLAVADRDMQRWNIASDACIHTALAPTHGDGPPAIITLAGLREHHPRVAASAACDGSRAQPIYDCLDMGDGGDVGDEGCGITPMAADAAAQDRAAAEYARAIVAQAVGAAAVQAPRRQRVPSMYREPTAARVVRHLAQRLRGVHGEILQRTRSWARPGRLPVLPGSARRPRARIAVLIDRSGSMDAAHAAIDYLSAIDLDVVWIAWASTAQRVARPHDPADVGGGTLLTPALALASASRPEHIVIISDALLGDAPSPPAVPVTWVVVGSTTPAWGQVVRSV